MKLSLIISGTLAVLLISVMFVAPAGADQGKPSIAVADVSVSPSALMPGDTGTVTVTLVNPAQSLTGSTRTTMETYNFGSGESNGMATPSHSEQTTVQSSDAPDGAVMLKEVALLADPHIRVVSSYHFLDIGRIGMGCSYKFTFIIKADEAAADASYFLTVKVRTGDDGVYLNYPVTVKVDSTPLELSVSDAPGAFTSARQTVSLDVVNGRPNDVRGVAVVASGEGFGFNPLQQYVIGAIGAGQMYTAQFDVSADNASSAGDPAFRVVYMNGDNRHESGPVTIRSDHGTAAAAAPMGIDGGGALYVAGIVAVFAILLGGSFLYLRGKRAKK